ncbi:ogr/Delta-like zinc finger family protein [Carnimonas bestiolae]|uniref:ogr/Delta-like zinc finger family protein n=1 Tax=Carnimonas bestiolae TaxID=3402172 RepID=UPI003EDBAF1A
MKQTAQRRESRHAPAPGVRIDDSKRKNGLRLTCPYCGFFVRVRTSEYISEALISGLVECQRATCGWRGHFTFNITETTQMCELPGADDVRLGIKLSPFLERKLAAKAAQTKTPDLYNSPTIH